MIFVRYEALRILVLRAFYILFTINLLKPCISSTTIVV
nr:MAG TPA: hypothetical protein [Caudoviricetes sp.]